MIKDRIETFNEDLSGLVGSVVEVDQNNSKVLVDPEYRAKCVDLSGRDPLDSERIWVKMDKLVNVLRRGEMVEISDTDTFVELEGRKSSHFSIDDL